MWISCCAMLASTRFGALASEGIVGREEEEEEEVPLFGGRVVDDEEEEEDGAGNVAAPVVAAAAGRGNPIGPTGIPCAAKSWFNEVYLTLGFLRVQPQSAVRRTVLGA